MLIVNDWAKEKKNQIRKEIGEKFQHTSPMQTTDIKMIVLNSGVGKAAKNKQLLENTEKLMQQIGQGQKPVRTYAHKSITTFELREGMSIGCKLTLRKEKVWNFLFALINWVFANIKDFSGFSLQSFDQKGNYNLGIKDLNAFPEATYDLTFKNQGLQVTIVFTSNSLKENRYFLEQLGFPFRQA